MSRFVKTCCISSIAEAEMALAVGADAIGLVGPMPSGPGVIDRDAIVEIAAAMAGRIRRFLLTSQTSVDTLVTEARETDVDVIQLVDAVPDGLGALRREMGAARQIVQVIHVVDEAAIDEARAAAPHVDAILLDSGRPHLSVKELGGTGRVHDWSISKRIVDAVTTPVLLAGGLNPSNVTAAVRGVDPWGVDVCSGVRVDGVLDEARLRTFVARARSTP